MFIFIYNQYIIPPLPSIPFEVVLQLFKMVSANSVAATHSFEFDGNKLIDWFLKHVGNTIFTFLPTGEVLFLAHGPDKNVWFDIREEDGSMTHRDLDGFVPLARMASSMNITVYADKTFNICLTNSNGHVVLDINGPLRGDISIIISKDGETVFSTQEIQFPDAE